MWLPANLLHPFQATVSSPAAVFGKCARDRRREWEVKKKVGCMIIFEKNTFVYCYTLNNRLEVP